MIFTIEFTFRPLFVTFKLIPLAKAAIEQSKKTEGELWKRQRQHSKANIRSNTQL